LASKDDSGVVGTAGGITINLGGFQSVRTDCWATLPCTVKSAKSKYKKCCEFVMSKIEEDANKVYTEYRDINGSLKNG
jgi:hypothetical protein